MVRRTEEDWLAERARRGDLDAFNSLVLHYQARVYNLCLRMLGNRQAAEDATQNSFLLAYRAIGRFRGGSIQAWLLRIAANVCYDEIRRRARRPALSLDAQLDEEPLQRPAPPSQEPGPEQEVLRDELRREIERGLVTLQPDQRLAVILCDVQGLSYDEIAGVMHTSLGTVKSRVSRGRAKLRDYLRASEELLPAIERQQY